MFGYILYVVVIPLVLFWGVRRLNTAYHINGNIWLLVTACGLFSTATFYPSPLIHGQNTQFMTHLFGGGMMVGLLWLYAMPLMRGLTWWQKAVILYAAVCSLGVLNELYELWAFENRLITVPITDTSWDLLANTLGAALVYTAFYLFTFLCDRTKK